MEIIQIEPQTCKNGSKEDLLNLNGKFIAQEKLDGHRAIMQISEDMNRFFSRRDSVLTGKKEENTDKLPHLRDKDLHTLAGTILDGEVVIAQNSNSTKVQSVMGSLPERALEWQKENGFIEYKVFDIIYYNGKYVGDLPFIERYKILDNIRYMFNEYMSVVPIYFDDNVSKEIYSITVDLRKNCKDYDLLLKNFWKDGKEGIVLKDIDAPYKQSRNKNFLKFKQEKTADLVMLGVSLPEKHYTGKFTKEQLIKRGWEYWEDGEPITKSWFNGWVGGISLGAYKNGRIVYVCTVKGFPDSVQEQIKSFQGNFDNIVVEVCYQGIQNEKKKSLRHPRFHCFRFDKSRNSCLWEDIE